MKIEISIYEENYNNNKLEDIIYESIIIEKIDTKYVKIEKSPLQIKIDAPSITRARAIMNSYILWIYTILKSLEEVKKSGREITSRSSSSTS
ncbi:KEOPS complex subunit Pcc1 [Sulfolobus sp. E11-6]|uniref:KEOPS complex subunit Pcc1 n=1 Tax=Sulfolobus sp. E11-6 TaxID=2663020 RepID=UPI0012981845|nr:KEOPS complex subunit Pcc1 [Sulfolobus sp. E11-6]QGA69535.1 KEOPS complex Pcc1 subunit [Sulfolobus sp. E11-6]